jgi:two-component system cell cycle response regulator DivK
VTRLLYVEDNDDNVYMLKMRLELTDEYEVLVAEDGERGCDMAAQEKPDLILMDLELPGVDGWDSRPIRRLVRSRSSPFRPMRSPARARRRWPPAATSSTPSRWNSSV